MVLQAYLDDSYTENGMFVLAGYVARAEAWADFSREWEALLPHTYRGRTGRHRFKMREMVRKMDHVQSFYRVIEDHVALRLSCELDLGDLRRARERVWVDGINIDFGFASNPFELAFEHLLGVLADLEMTDHGIEFYFDDHTSKQAVLDAWERFMAGRSDAEREAWGAAGPRFKNDEFVLPLQAAAFWAWWLRRGYETGTIEAIMRDGNFGFWKETRSIPEANIRCTADDLVASIVATVRSRLTRIGLKQAVHDAKLKPRPKDSFIVRPKRLLTRLRRFLPAA